MHGPLSRSEQRPRPAGSQAGEGDGPPPQYAAPPVQREHLANEGEVPREVHFVSWNLGGVKAQQALETARMADSGLGLPRPEFIMLQEVPRQEAGWHQYSILGYTAVQFRMDMQWRGNAVLVDEANWAVVRRKAGANVVWVRARRKGGKEQCWIGSMYLSTGVPADVTEAEIKAGLDLLPATDLPILLAADFNAVMTWGEVDNDLVTVPNNQKARFIAAALQDRGMALMAPDERQRHQPTSRPRKRTARGNQIDGVASQQGMDVRWRILVDTHKQISTDHERCAGRWVQRCIHTCTMESSGPRVVTSRPPTLTHVDQDVMRRVARTCTGPRRSEAYSDPPTLKQALRVARVTRTAASWKRVFQARTTARKQWMDDRIERALQGDWKIFKQVAKPKTRSWDTSLAQQAEDLEKDPHEWIVEHFRDCFQEQDASVFPGSRWPGTQGTPFDVTELRHALSSAKTGKSVGLDLTSTELLRAICEDGASETAVLEWLEGIRASGAVPQDWKATCMTLLPKIAAPLRPKDLRPIALSSAVSKLFCSMLLARTRAVIHPVSYSQCAFSGRQAADYLHAGIRGFQLETEWRSGCHWLRLDVAKAFDRLRRQKVLHMLRARLPATMAQEFQCWVDLMRNNTTEVRTPWGSTVIPQTRGVRQGSVESLFIFAVCMELALESSQRDPRWPRCTGMYENYPTPELLYMDDGVIQAWKKLDLEVKMDILINQLREWGLELNAEKCTYYRSPYANDGGPLRVGTALLDSAAELQMMGLSLTVPLRIQDLIRPAMQKARKKYYALRHLLEQPTAIKHRLKLFDKTVSPACLWCASVIPALTRSLSEVNALQLGLVAKMMGSKRKAAENWVEHRTRTYREARALLQLHGHKRWSTQRLTRRWRYLGHVIRAVERPQPPASTLIMNFRTLSWWRAEQKNQTGTRHGHRFFPTLMNEEQRLTTACGGVDWRTAAMDRDGWANLLTKWVDSEDVAWTSGRQIMLQNA